MDSLQLLVGKMQNSRDLRDLHALLRIPFSSERLWLTPGVSVGLLAAFYRLDDRCYP